MEQDGCLVMSLGCAELPENINRTPMWRSLFGKVKLLLGGLVVVSFDKHFVHMLTSTIHKEGFSDFYVFFSNFQQFLYLVKRPIRSPSVTCDPSNWFDSSMYNFSPVFNLVSPATIFSPPRLDYRPKKNYFPPILGSIYPPYSQVLSPSLAV